MSFLPQGNNLSFRDQICIITGSARGIGKSHALAFASCGAFVVIHDVDEKEATETADYINKTFPTNSTYPRAITCTHSMTQPESVSKIIQQSTQSFPTNAKLTILVNNAGILRDRSFANMTEQQWDQIYQVHLYGVFLLTRAVWNVFKIQKFGRVIFTTSVAGLYGNFGQANYGACKEALCGLARTLSIESDRIGDVCVNCVSPLAGTRLWTQQPNIDKNWLDALKVEMVSPLVLFLSSSKCKENGQIYEVGGGVIIKVRYERGIPFYCDNIQDALNTEIIEKNWSKINSFFATAAEETGFIRNPRSATESFQNIIKHATNIAKNQSTNIKSSSPRSDDTVVKQSEVKKPQGKKIVAGLTRAENPSEVNIDGYQCSEIFGRMISLFKEHSDLTQKYKVTYVFDLVNNNNKTIKKQWTLNMKNAEDCGVYMGVPQIVDMNNFCQSIGN